MLHKIYYGLQNRKGTAMVEATIYMPIVLLTIVAVLNLSISMYEKIAIQTTKHGELRKTEQRSQADFARKYDMIQDLSEIVK